MDVCPSRVFAGPSWYKYYQSPLAVYHTATKALIINTTSDVAKPITQNS